MAIQIFKICRDQITMRIFRANVREYMKSTRSWRYLVTTSAKETFVLIHLCVCVLTVCTVKHNVTEGIVTKQLKLITCFFVETSV